MFFPGVSYAPRTLSLGFSWYFAKYHKVKDPRFHAAFQSWALVPQPFGHGGQISDHTCATDLGERPEDSLSGWTAGPNFLRHTDSAGPRRSRKPDGGAEGF